ncbi:multiple inositol polyphosphate phosphatase 1-like [Menidia menidia]
MFPAVAPAHGLLLAALSLAPGRASATHVPHIAAYFGTKTRYEEVNPQLLRDPLAVNASVLPPPACERCSPLHRTAITRHVSRLPTAKNIRRILRLSELVWTEASGGWAGSSGGSSGWLQDTLSRWEPWYTEDMDGEGPGSFPPTEQMCYGNFI